MINGANEIGKDRYMCNGETLLSPSDNSNLGVKAAKTVYKKPLSMQVLVFINMLNLKQFINKIV